MSTFRPQLHWQSPAARISAVMKSRASNCPQVSRRHSELRRSWWCWEILAAPLRAHSWRY
ncbi:hypothetical protein INR49_000460 [Caranx melampygus]|nr:hypothetical protein INR49_000460 [Caranx melampygus]